MKLVKVARSVDALHGQVDHAALVEVSVEFDPADEAALVRNMSALEAMTRVLEAGGEEYRCPGCWVGRGAVHVPDCVHAPDDLIELCRAEMEAAV